MPTVQDRWINKVLGGTRYIISEKLGEGGMGAVYLAEDRQHGGWVVIKVPHSSLVRDAEFTARFKLEVQSLIALSHPGIVRVLDVGQYGEFPFVVLQFLSGGSLESRIYQAADGASHPQSLTQVCAWLTEIATALDFIHLQGYIHRDIKPANILFDESEHPYLTDFGIAKVLAKVEESPSAKLTGTGMILGTAEYMAPELLQGKPIDRRVDQYALAVTVFEVLSGSRPYEGNTPAALAFAQIQQPIPQIHHRLPALSEEVSCVLSRALSVLPSERFRSCTEFADALRLAGRNTAKGTAKRDKLGTSSTSPIANQRTAPESLVETFADAKPLDTDHSRRPVETPETSSDNPNRRGQLLIVSHFLCSRRTFAVAGLVLLSCLMIGLHIPTGFFQRADQSRQQLANAPVTSGPGQKSPTQVANDPVTQFGFGSPKSMSDEAANKLLEQRRKQLSEEEIAKRMGMSSPGKNSFAFGKNQVGLPTAEADGAIWEYSTSDPGPNWETVEYDSSKWKSGRSGFGLFEGNVAFGLKIVTPWSANDIWLRTRVTVPAIIENAIVTWRYYHDEDIEIYVNGQLFLAESGFSTKYMTHVAERPLLRAGENVVAVHCRNVGLPAGVDVGFAWKEILSVNSAPAEVNRPPVIDVIPDQIVTEDGTLQLTVTARDPDRRFAELRYALQCTPAVDANMNPNTGMISWSPRAADVGQTFVFAICVSKADHPQSASVRDFKVRVQRLPRYDLLLEENNRQLRWRERINQNSAELGLEILKECRSFDWRPTCLAGYRSDIGDDRYVSIWISNGERIFWDAKFGLQQPAWQNLFNAIPPKMAVIWNSFNQDRSQVILWADPNPLTLAVQHGRTRDDLQKYLKTIKPTGYHPVAVWQHGLNLFGFHAVIKPIDSVYHVELTDLQLGAILASLPKYYRLIWIDGFGQGTNRRYSYVAIRHRVRSKPEEWRLNLKPQELQQALDDARLRNMIPLVIDVE